MPPKRQNIDPYPNDDDNNKKQRSNHGENQPDNNADNEVSIDDDLSLFHIACSNSNLDGIKSVIGKYISTSSPPTTTAALPPPIDIFNTPCLKTQQLPLQLVITSQSPQSYNVFNIY